MELWQQILLNEEKIRIQGQQSAVPSSPQHGRGYEKQKGADPYTFIFEKTNFSPTLQCTVLIDETGKRGVVQDIVILADNPNFTVDLEVDTVNTRLHKSWAELVSIAEHIDGITAVERDGKYLASFSNFYFSDSIRIAVIATSVTFDKLFLQVKFNG